MHPGNRMKLQLGLVVLVIASFCLASAFGQALPNFSGTWSQTYPPTSAMYSRTDKILQQDSTLKVFTESKSSGGLLASGYSMDRTYNIGGKEEVTKSDTGRVRTLSVKWEGTALLFLRTEVEGANTTTTREVWSLSTDGKTFTRNRTITTSNGTKEEKTVLEKQ
jgi:hypothetical protein